MIQFDWIDLSFVNKYVKKISIQKSIIIQWIMVYFILNNLFQILFLYYIILTI